MSLLLANCVFKMLPDDGFEMLLANGAFEMLLLLPNNDFKMLLLPNSEFDMLLLKLASGELVVVSQFDGDFEVLLADSGFEMLFLLANAEYEM